MLPDVQDADDVRVVQGSGRLGLPQEALALILAGQRAAEQAAHEGRKVWGVAEDAPIPFNQRWEHVEEVVQLAL